MAKVTIDNADLESMLRWLTKFEEDPEVAFSLCACAAAALARDIGNLSKKQFLDNVDAAWEATPEGLLSPVDPDPDKREFDA